jgi:arylsulfatase A-like enzyme
VCEETLSLVDLAATVAAVVGKKLPPADLAAEDSYNILPAFLGEPHEVPLRPHLLLHSDEGVFAIRQNSWKYIEGKPHPAVGRGDHPAPSPQVRAAEFKPQLYNVADDPGEKHDLIEQHPDEAKHLAELLDKLHLQNHSR